MGESWNVVNNGDWNGDLEWLRSVGSKDLGQAKRYSQEIRGFLGGFLFSFSISVFSTGFDGLDMLKLFLVEAVDSDGSSIAGCLDTRAQNRMNTTYLAVNVDRNVVQFTGGTHKYLYGAVDHCNFLLRMKIYLR
jgi:hypothetical protein